MARCVSQLEKGPCVLNLIFHAVTHTKGALVKTKVSRRKLKRASYTLQAAEPPCSANNGPI